MVFFTVVFIPSQFPSPKTMSHFIFRHLSLSFFLFLFCSGVAARPAAAIPVLKDTAKRAVSVQQAPPKNGIKNNVPMDIKVLGAYRNISTSKKKVNSSETKTARAAETAEIDSAIAAIGQTVADKPVLQVNAPQGHENTLSIKNESRVANSSLQKKLSAKSAIIIDGESGQTLFAVSPDTPRQPASTIKILTGLVAIKSLNFEEAVSVSVKAAGQPSSKVNLDHQKQYKADDLINAVLLSSANDASVALAEKIAGSENSFAKMMTMQAKLCGAQQTVCKTANGLTADGQSSTARDLAYIFRHAMQDDEFAQRMKQIKVHTAEGKLLKNHNKALWQIQGAEGGKTGFTNAAGQTYVGKFKRGSREIIVAIMGSSSMWMDLKNLVEYGFSRPVTNVATGAEEGTKREKPKMVAAVPVADLSATNQ